MAAGGLSLHAANPPMAATTPFGTVLRSGRGGSLVGPALLARSARCLSACCCCCLLLLHRLLLPCYGYYEGTVLLDPPRASS